MFIGQQIYSSISCPSCGQQMGNSMSPQSAFMYCTCQTKDCDNWGIGALIEKASMQVIQVREVYIVDGKRAWPMLVNEEGKLVWPKPTPEIFEKSSEG